MCEIGVTVVTVVSEITKECGRHKTTCYRSTMRRASNVMLQHPLWPSVFNDKLIFCITSNCLCQTFLTRLYLLWHFQT